MSGTEYTPTTHLVRALYDDRTRTGEFNRWLASHDAEVRAEQIEMDARIADDAERRWLSLGPGQGSQWLSSRDAIARDIRAQLNE